MTQEEFVATYCTNEKRYELFAALEEKLCEARDSLKPFRIVVYGSFVTLKQFPADIDVLIWGDLVLEKRTDKPYELRSSAKVHIKSTIRLPGPKPPLPSAEAMVAAFNDANQTNDVRIHGWVELETDDTRGT